MGHGEVSPSLCCVAEPTASRDRRTWVGGGMGGDPILQGSILEGHKAEGFLDPEALLPAGHMLS